MPKKQNMANGDKPATQADLAAWGGQLTQHITSVEEKLGGRMDKFDSRMDRFEGRIDSLERGQRAVLNILEEIKDDVKAIKHLPAEVERLKRAVFRS